MRAPPSQSIASGLVARLAVVFVRGRLKRSQASEWATCVSPEIPYFRCSREFSPGKQHSRRREGESKGGRRGGWRWHAQRGRPGNLGDP